MTSVSARRFPSDEFDFLDRDAGNVHGVEQAVAAAQDGLLVATQARVGKAEARAEVVVIAVDEVAPSGALSPARVSVSFAGL